MKRYSMTVASTRGPGIVGIVFMVSDIQQLRQQLASGRLTISRLDDGSGVVLDAERERLFSLNATGLSIIQAIADGAEDEQAILAVLVERFDADPAAAREDIEEFVAGVVHAL